MIICNKELVYRYIWEAKWYTFPQNDTTLCVLALSR